MNFETFWSFANSFLLQWQQAGSRLFYWNLISTLFLVFAWSAFSFGTRTSFQKSLSFIFRKRYWWNRSTLKDYWFFTTNFFLKVVLFLPVLDFSYHIARGVSGKLVDWNQSFLGLEASFFAVALFTLGSFVWDDFLRFVHHLLMHKVPFLWRLHQVHHSAKILTPLTLYRAHPLEVAMATLRNSLSIGISAGMFVFFFESSLNLWTLAGVNAFGFVFNFLGANLRHSHIPLGFGSLIEKIFISPKQHQIHHSANPEHWDRNYGVSLALWDGIFGSLVLSKNTGKLKFGLGSVQNRSLLKEYGLDLKSCKTVWKSQVGPRPNRVFSDSKDHIPWAPHKDSESFQTVSP